MDRKPRVLFLGRGYAGHGTRFSNFKFHTENDHRISARYRLVNGWEADGLIERLPLLPQSTKGRLRAIRQTAHLATFPRPDAIWTGLLETAVPYLWSQLGPLRRPLILDLDSTVEQLEGFANHYWNRPAKQGKRLEVAKFLERMVWGSTSLFTPWSEWAAASLRRAGVDSSRIRVLPPGVDLEAWSPSNKLTDSPKLRALFVGGDFFRKGGDILLQVAPGLSDRYEFDVVTRDAIDAPSCVRLHRAEPNSEALRSLYERADVFVMPTRAECFGIAIIEAMASGLPCIVGNVGGVGEITHPGETGWLIDPSIESLRSALNDAYTRQLAPMLKSDLTANTTTNWFWILCYNRSSWREAKLCGGTTNFRHRVITTPPHWNNCS
jgi:glycosyltransferase involved in cell wall biosynthesis